MKRHISFILFVACGLMSFSKREIHPVKHSEIHWKAYKVGGFHEGTIELKNGFLEMDGDEILGGEFITDMTTINLMDVSGKSKKNLDNHLKSVDFFSVEKYKTSKLVFKKIETQSDSKHTVTAALTIKGVSHDITFDLNKKSAKTYSAGLKVDRAKYKVEYNSGSFFENLGDKLIYDDFDIDIEFSI